MENETEQVRRDLGGAMSWEREKKCPYFPEEGDSRQSYACVLRSNSEDLHPGNVDRIGLSAT